MSDSKVNLTGLFAFKVGMSSVYNENNEVVPVTVLKYEPWTISQIKTKEKDGYSSLQIAARPKGAKNSSKAESGHLKNAGFKGGAYFVREVRQEIPDGAAVGQQVDIASFAKGDVVQVTGTSKGRGFAGVVKRYHFAGGPAAHGSKFHRQPGSSGNRTWPGRIMPGKRFPGHLGAATATVKNLVIVDIIPEENVILVKGGVPGARNSLVQLVKV